MRHPARIALLFVFVLCGATAFAQSHLATMTWTAAQQPTGVTLASWNLLRGAASGGPYQQIANVPASTTNYTDNTVSSGQNYFYVVQAVDTTGDVSVNSMEVEAVIPNSTPPLAVSTTSLPPATTGTSYSVPITASGGTGPYTWSGTGVDGLTLSGSGLLSGTPSQAGTFAQSVTVKDSTSATSSASLTLSVAAPTAPLAVSTTSLPPATAGASYSATITASGGTAPYTWVGTGIDGLTFSANGVLSGIPSQTGTFTQNVTVKDSTAATASASLTLSVTAPASPLVVSTASLPPATAGTSYSATIAASEGAAPYSWSGTGVDGLTFSASGVLSGIPSQAGTFTQNATVKDSKGATASASLTLSVTAPASPLVVSTASLPPATAGTSYSATIAASGGAAPYTWSGTGVSGLTFSANGVLSGTPTQAGTFPQSVTVTDSTGAAASASLTLTVASAPGGGTPIALVQHASKDAGATASSTLTFPSGNTVGNWIAVSIRVGAANATFRVGDSNGNTYRKAIQFSLTVDPDTLAIFYAENIAGGANTVTVSDNTSATLRFAILEYSGVATSGSFDAAAVTEGSSASPNSGSVATAVNGELLLGAIMTSDPETYTARSGYRIEESVPAEPGTKLITEDQVQAAAGPSVAAAVLAATDEWAAGIAAFKPAGSGGATAPAITSASSTTLTAGAAGSFTVTTTGMPTPSLTESGALPVGVMFIDNGNGSATLSGTPSSGSVGTYSITITATNGVGTPASEPFTLMVASTLAVSTSNLPPATAGASYSATISASGGTVPYTWVGTGVDGLTFSANGVLSGTPAQAGTFTQNVTVKDSTGATASASLALSVAAPTAPLAVSTTSLPPATAGTSYSATITASGGAAPYTWSGTGVDGLSFSANGVLSGTPTQAGTFTQNVTVKDSTGATASASLALSVAAPTAPLAVSTTSLPPATAGTSYSATISASGGTAPYTWVGTGIDGLTFSANGVLSGIPSQAGTFTQNVTVKDSTGATASASLALSVAAPTAPLAVSTPSLPPATAGTSYSATISASGGTAPYTWVGTGIDGLTFSANGVLSGIPSQAGTFTQNVTVKDSTAATASASLTLSVTAPASPLVVSTASLPPATAGTSYSATIAASGGAAPYSWSGTGVDGLTFSANGVLSGTPTQAGTFTQNVTVNDAAKNTASASLTLSVGGAPSPSATPVAPVVALDVRLAANRLSWTLQTQPSGVTVGRWRIFRSTDGTSYTVLGHVPVGTMVYRDTNVSSGQTYYYVVEAVSTAGAISQYSNVVEGTRP